LPPFFLGLLGLFDSLLCLLCFHVDDLEGVERNHGTDTSQLEALLAEVVPEKSAGSKARPVSRRELELTRKEPEELVTSPEELERLRTLACPHIRDSLF